MAAGTRSQVSGWLVATVVSVTAATEHGRIIVLDVPGWPGNQPGQHLDLRLTADDGYQAVRSYSIASFGPDRFVELGVDEYAAGEVSPYLVRELRAGDLVEVRGPIGRYFVWSRRPRPEPGPADRRRIRHRAAHVDRPRPPRGGAPPSRCACSTRSGRRRTPSTPTS